MHQLQVLWAHAAASRCNKWGSIDMMAMSNSSSQLTDAAMAHSLDDTAPYGA